jgi:hypothetical protein
MATLEEAIAKRKEGFYPYHMAVDAQGKEWELISFPYPEDNGLFIRAREKDRCDTAQTFRVEDLTPDALYLPPKTIIVKEVETAGELEAKRKFFGGLFDQKRMRAIQEQSEQRAEAAREEQHRRAVERSGPADDD